MLRLLRLLLPLCLVVATAVAVQGLWRVLGRTTGSAPTQQAVSLQLGASSAADRPAVAAASPPEPTRAAANGPRTTATHTPARPVGVTAAVDVVNASGISGLARRTATDLRAKGVTVASVGNLRPTGSGKPTARTVYYPPGAAPQARALARLADAAVVAPAPTGIDPHGKLVLVVTEPAETS